MLPRQKRLSRKLFTELLSGGRSAFSPVFTVRFLPTGEKFTRFSFVAPKSVAKSAVLRNTLRRRGYSAIRKIEGEVMPGFICALFFKKGSEKLNFREIEGEVRAILGKARLLKY